jgi:ribonuclease HI
MIEIWFDGACEPTNPGGYMGFGYVIKEDGKNIATHSTAYSLDEWKARTEDSTTTNNIAEYRALCLALWYLKKQSMTDKEVKVYGDSQLVINQMFGTWRIKEGHYKRMAFRCKELLTNFPNIRGEWVRREQNEEADELSKKALLKRGIQPARRCR